MLTDLNAPVVCMFVCAQCRAELSVYDVRVRAFVAVRVFLSVHICVWVRVTASVLVRVRVCACALACECFCVCACARVRSDSILILLCAWSCAASRLTVALQVIGSSGCLCCTTVTTTYQPKVNRRPKTARKPSLTRGHIMLVIAASLPLWHA